MTAAPPPRRAPPPPVAPPAPDNGRPRVTLGLSAHRAEALDAAAATMAAHDVVVLEEPPMIGFDAMLDGGMAVDDYLEENAFEFPELARRTCAELRRLHGDGVRIVQVEPFLETLVAVHDAFEAGQRPADVENDGVRGEVYRAERSWTAALMAYYWTAPTNPFDDALAALQAFARQDAARGRLRDRMRADALGSLVTGAGDGARVYVEAGYLHVGLRRRLSRRLPAGVPLRTFLPMAPVYRRLCGRPQLLAPGDRLTLRYTFTPTFEGPRADLLAARALVHVKLERKDEMVGDDGATPHAEDEVSCARLVEALSLDDCRELFAQVRRQPTPLARAIVRSYLSERGRSPDAPLR